MHGRLTAIAILGLATAGTLAGCSSAADAASTGTIDANGATTLADGDYSATGQYLAPSGRETVDVDLTLQDGVVTALAVTGSASDPEAKQYQDAFVSGIDAAVVGKPIDSLQVSNVAGSSLTSQGFNTAISDIIAQAQG